MYTLYIPLHWLDHIEDTNDPSDTSFCEISRINLKLKTEFLHINNQKFSLWFQNRIWF